MPARKLISCVYGVIAATFAGSASLAQAPELTLAIDLGKAQVSVGEPVYAMATLTNVSTRPVEGSFALAPEIGGIHIEIDSAGARVGGFTPLAAADAELPRVTLAPGESVGRGFPIFYGARGWTFATAGDYQIRASYQEPGLEAPVVAAPVALSVVEDTLGRALVDDPSGEAGKYMLWLGGDHLQVGRRLLTGAAQPSSTSPVAQHVRWLLGESLSRPFRNFVENAVRPPQPRESLNLLGAVDPNALAPFAQMMLHTARARDYTLLGIPEERDGAIAAARAVAAAYPSLDAQTEAIISEILSMRLANPTRPPN